MATTDGRTKALNEAPDWLYRFDRSAAGVHGFEAVDEEALAHFHREGYLVVHEAFGPEEVAAAIAELDRLIAEDDGSLNVVQYERHAPEGVRALPLEQKRDHVRKLFLFVQHSPPLLQLVHHEGLQEVLRRLMGGDEPAMFQDMALLKPPGSGTEKPWHQDCAYFNLPLDTCVVGCWLALDAALPDNGCMHVVPGSHREGPRVHWQRRDWQVCDTDVPVERDVMVPLEPGGCLLFHGLLLHGTPPNRSPHRRRALQYHYKPARVSFTALADRLAVFGSEGKDVEC